MTRSESAMDAGRRIEIPTGFCGVVERNDGALLMMGQGLVYVSEDGGPTWSEPSRLTDEQGTEIQAGSCSGLLRLPSGALAAVLMRSDDFAGQWPEWGDLNAFVFIRSDDEGKTWREVGRITPPGCRAFPLDNTLAQLESGRLVQPLRYCFAGAHPDRRIEEYSTYGWLDGKRVQVSGHYHYPEVDVAFVCYSDDEGKTWQRSKGDIMCWFDEGFDGVHAVDEPNVAETRDGRLLMFARSTVGRIVQSESRDRGETWSLVMPAGLANSYSPPRLKRIPKTGDLLLIWNQVSREEIRRGHRRGRLSAAISTDEGRTWKNFKTLELSGGLDKSLRFVEPGEVKPVRGLRDVGELPADFGYYHYANASFVGDKVFVTYLHGSKEIAEIITDKQTPLLRILPLEWFYRDDASD